MLLLLLLVACTTPALLEGRDEPAVTWPSGCMEVSGEPVDLGPVLAGEVARTELSIDNPCEGDLLLERIEVTGQGFSTAGPLPLVVPADSTGRLELGFAPLEQGDYQGRLVLVDSLGARATIQLLGEGLAPRVEVSPDQVDLGLVPVGCSAEQPLQVAGVGPMDLAVHAAWSTDPSLVVEADLPAVLAPDEVLDLSLRWEPLEQGLMDAWLVLETDDFTRPQLMVSVLGQSQADPTTEVHEIPDQSMVDLIVTMDRSGGCSDDQRQLIDQVPALVGALGAQSDYHIMVSVEDDGCPLGSVPYIDTSFSASAAAATFDTQADL